jgi:integral membrane protein (TIGR01906 family)
MNADEPLLKNRKKTTRESYPSLAGTLSWVVTLLVPVVLVLASVRLLLTPVFLTFEYSTPNFPPDTYGFTKQDRLYWSAFALDYLINQEGISFLGDLRFADGSSVFNQRELEHMIDVKIVLQRALLVWYLSLGAMFLLGIWAWRGGWLFIFLRGLSRGGFVTSLLVFVIVVFVLASFGIFFVAFHQVFFESGTWVFNYSYTLIRLFPERFWKDIFIYVGVLTLVGGLILGFILRNKPKNILTKKGRSREIISG